MPLRRLLIYEQLIDCPDEDFFIELVAKHCVYDKRLKILNFCQKLYLLIFNAVYAHLLDDMP